MRLIMIAGGVSLFVAILLTPFLIKLFSRQGFGQEIRFEGPESHRAKRGTPTMGGGAIIGGMWAG
ncbi:MAG: phospho-N-acetylmuramoyl-pentapeptide-transferase, partial [Pseudonocardia sp.]|nr:phospho-N-acetylmuramoyl-pentapeptide-transferase [Pseudonocardia sp.]